MPWCEGCERFYTPSTLTAEGDCPEGHHVADPQAVVQSDSMPDAGESEEKVRAPWHFWLLLAAVVIYLGWRLIQGIQWLLS